MTQGCLGDDVLAGLDRRLAETDAFLARAYPGEDGRRQPVHTVYVAADQVPLPGSKFDHRQNCRQGRGRSPSSDWNFPCHCRVSQVDL